MIPKPKAEFPHSSNATTNKEELRSTAPHQTSQTCRGHSVMGSGFVVHVASRACDGAGTRLLRTFVFGVVSRCCCCSGSRDLFLLPRKFRESLEAGLRSSAQDEQNCEPFTHHWKIPAKPSCPTLAHPLPVSQPCH